MSGLVPRRVALARLRVFLALASVVSVASVFAGAHVGAADQGSGKTAGAVSTDAVADSSCETSDVWCATLTAGTISGVGVGYVLGQGGTLTDPTSGTPVTGFDYNNTTYTIGKIASAEGRNWMEFGLIYGQYWSGLSSLTLVVGDLNLPFSDATSVSGATARWNVAATERLTAGSSYTVRIFQADRAGTVPLDPADPVVGTAVTASLSDPDGGVTGTTWQWASSSDWDGSSGTWSDISGATSASYTPVAGDVGGYLRATAGYDDNHGTGKTAAGVSDSAVIASGCETSDVWCATLTAGTGTAPAGVGYSMSSYGSLSPTTFTYSSQNFDVGDLFITTLSNVELYFDGNDPKQRVSLLSGLYLVLNGRTYAFDDGTTNYPYLGRWKLSGDAMTDGTSYVVRITATAPIPGCETSDVWCATLTAGTGTAPAGVGYSVDAYGSLSPTTFTYSSQNFDVGDLFITTLSNVELYFDGNDPKQRVSLLSGLYLVLNGRTYAFDDGTTNYAYLARWKLSGDAMTDGTSYVVRITATAPNNPPVFTGGDTQSRSVDENSSAGEDIGDAVAATDGDGDTITYSLGGTDAGSFAIVDTSGQLETSAALNHESKAGYTVEVTADDGTDSATATVTITVTNVDEAGSVTLDNPSPSVGDTVTASLSDPDGGETGISWQWAWSDDGTSGWDSISGATSASYTVESAYLGDWLRASASYTDGEGSGKTAAEVTDDAVQEAGSNQAPVITNAPSSPVEVAENSSVGTLVFDLNATDADGDTLTWSLSGSSPFAIDGGNGRITVNGSLDFETRASYTLTAVVSDGSSSDTATVNVTVTDVDEPPGAPDAPTVGGASTTSLTVTWSAPADNGSTITDYDVQYRRGASGTWLAHTHVGAARSATIGGLAEGASYQVRVRAENTHGEGGWSDPGTGSTLSPSGVPGKVGVPTVGGASTTSLTVTWGAPADNGSAITDYDVQYRRGASGTWLAHTHVGAARSATIGGLAEGASYQVRVRAENAHGEGGWSDPGTGSTLSPTTPPPKSSDGGGPSGGGSSGGGSSRGGGPGGAAPSSADFAWNVTGDIDSLAVGHDNATGLWGDGEILWVGQDGAGAADGVFAYDLVSGDRDAEREFELDAANRAPRGLWGDGVTLWVSDSGQGRVFAYRLARGERDEEREFELDAANVAARGIWGDGVTLWVLDGFSDAVFAYDLASGEGVGRFALHGLNRDPHGIWSDGTGIWVSDGREGVLFAYRLEGETLVRVRAEEFTELYLAGNDSPRGIWSDGELMYVADPVDDRVYTYNMPDAANALLASLTLSGVDIGAFNALRTSYVGVAEAGVTQTTVMAGPAQPTAGVVIAPADADGDARNGHQVATSGEVTVTVTSADGTRTKHYRVHLGPPPECPRGEIAAGFSAETYEGGSDEALEICA